MIFKRAKQANNPPQKLAATVYGSTQGADPVAPLRAVKRWVTIGVLGAIHAVVPLNYFVLDYSILQICISLLIGYVITGSAVHGAFEQIYALRRRGTYPGIVLMELSGVSSMAEGGQRALDVTHRLLPVRASFIAVRDRRGGIDLVAAAGLTPDLAAKALEEVRQAALRCISERLPVIMERRPETTDLLGENESLILIPAAGLGEPLGVLALAGRRRRELADDELLAGMGTALGISLDSLRQRDDLEEREERLRTVVTGAPIVVFATDADGRFTFLEGRVMERLGVPAEEIVGRRVEEVYRDYPEIIPHFQRALRGEEVSYSAEVRRMVFEAHMSPSIARDGRVTGVIGVATDATDRTRAEDALRESEEKYRMLVENTSEVIFTLNENAVCTYISPVIEQVGGFTPEELVGKDAREFIHPDDMPALTQDIRDAVKGDSHPGEFRVKRKAGDWCWVRIHSHPIFEGDTYKGIRGVLVDISGQKKAEEALRESEARYRDLFENANDIVFVHDFAGRFRSVNRAVEQVSGYSQEELLGLTVTELIDPEYHHAAAEAMKRVYSGEQDAPYEIEIIAKDGRRVPLEVSSRVLYRNGRAPLVQGIARDISERRRAEEAIRRLAYHDALTGLPNRALFEDRLNVALAQARRSDGLLAVMYMDVDRFKAVNDTVGHSGGDRLLQAIAADVLALVREGDTVARVGGDEFTILLPGISGVEDAVEVAERIIKSLKQPRMLDGREFHVTTSIGVTIYPRDGKDGEVLLRNADSAMYRAKEMGRDNYQFYVPEIDSGMAERLLLEGDLRHALELDELVLLYQPILETATNEIRGVEALLRWRHSTRGLIYPDAFIPVAEETGIIVELGEWVLRRACAQARAWQEATGRSLTVSVNLSARQLRQKNLVHMISAVLAETGLEPRCLQLEITEGAVMKNIDSIVKMLRRLREMGVGIAIDDFGTGYSSLSYLKKLPANTVKIDRSFIRDLEEDPNDLAIITTIIAMAHSLNLTVVAEGVETEGQLAFLRQQGCTEYQGYLAARPSPPERILRMISRDHQGTTGRQLEVGG